MNDERDFTQDILNVRFDALEHGELSNGAKVLFVYLLDLSLRRSTNDMPGVVTISQTQLAERLKSSRSRIASWKSELVSTGFVWTSQKMMPNTWPIERFHISGLAPRGRDVEKTTTEGCWGNGKRRQPLSGVKNDTGENTTQPAQPVEKRPVAVQKQHLSGVENDTGQVSKMIPARYQKRDRAGVENDTGQVSKMIPARYQKRDRTGVENETPNEDLRPEGKPFRGGKSPPPPFRSKILKEIDTVKAEIERVKSNGKREVRIAPAVLQKIKEIEAEIAKNPERKAELAAEIEERKTNPVYRGTFLASSEVAKVRALNARIERLNETLKTAI